MAQAAVKQAPPSAGHNLGLTDAEKRSLLVNGLAKIESFVEEKDAVVKDIREERKRLIAHGFSSKVIDFALRLRKTEDAEAIEQRRAEIEVAKFLGHPIGTQADLFDQPDRTPEVERAFAQGEIAGAEGGPCSSPWSTGSEQEQAWIKGWHEGQATLASAFKKLEATTEAVADGKTDDED